MKVTKIVSLKNFANKPISRGFADAPKNIEIEINNKKVKVRPGSTILQACASAGNLLQKQNSLTKFVKVLKSLDFVITRNFPSLVTAVCV